MKTTRRALLAMIGLGAAAAALAPTVSVQADGDAPSKPAGRFVNDPTMRTSRGTSPWHPAAVTLRAESRQELVPVFNPDGTVAFTMTEHERAQTFPVTARLVPMQQDSWFQGEGQAYNSSWWPGGYTREPGYALPVGWDDRAAEKTLIADAED